MARTKPGHDELKFCPATIPPTGRGSGIPFDRLNSIFAGAVAGTAEPPNHRRVAVGKSGKRRADTPAAPEGFLVVRSGPEQRTGRQKITQRQARVLTFGVPSRIGDRRSNPAFAVPANRERPRRGFVLSAVRAASGNAACLSRAGYFQRQPAWKGLRAAPQHRAAST